MTKWIIEAKYQVEADESFDAVNWNKLVNDYLIDIKITKDVEFNF
jgi:hypothetical protein